MPTIQTPDGISWYYEQSGSGPDVVLIPSGEGDCSAFDAVAKLLSKSFTVTTFDTPGMSRSQAPAAALEHVTGSVLATQIIGLMDALAIPMATFYGCSSGGVATLTLQAAHPARVRNAIVHEVPTPETNAHLPDLRDTTGAEDPDDPMDGFIRHFVGDRAAWYALPTAYHQRVAKNLPVWEKAYIPAIADSAAALVADERNLRHKPIDWTIGGLTPTALFFRNTEVAHRNNIPLSLLPCKHFPQVTIPDLLADHIERTTKKYL